MDTSDKVLDGLNILVAEDAEDIRVLFTRLLGRYGGNVFTAKDGEEAVEQMNRMSFDIVLMDLEMPHMDGMEAVIQLRKDGYLGKIVALSGHAWDSLAEALKQAGFDGYLIKPIALEDLVKQILFYCGRVKEVSAPAQA